MSHDGFRDALSTVHLVATQIQALDVTMQVGSAGQVVTVSAAPELLESDTSTFTNTLEEEALRDLPLNATNGRDAVQLLIQSTPSAAKSGISGNQVYSTLYLGGANSWTNTAYVDGVDADAGPQDLIEVEGGSEKEKMLFYSCLLHSFASPRLVAKKGEPFVTGDGKITTATYDRYTQVPFWDTGRNQIVLLTLLEPDVKTDILRSQLDMARESGYMGTSFHGDNAVFMYLGDWELGLDFDWAGAYEYLRKNATDPNGPRHYLDEYMKNGWISDFIPPNNPSPPYAGGKAGAATTLEYSWDDYAMAQYAKRLGRQADAAMFLQRAHNYRNVFDPSVGFVRGRTADGKWISPFDPGEPYYNFMMKEASGWSTLWLTPYDVQGIANELGGREKFAAKLDQFFSTPYTAKGVCRDCTGLVGEYVQGNQPDQQAPYYYDWAGQPWKTQALVRRILREMYGSDASGYAFPGMDDQGSTSSWYVMSAMGFYTVDPSSPNYILGSPIFRHVTMHMGNGKTFEITAHNNSDANIYIQSATLNGKPWNKPWFSHADIANGGKLELTMGSTPNKQWGSAADAAPPSMSQPESAEHKPEQAGK
jgi:predicted alpha-1,2-mannosidase